jgi:hypothetical protein
MKVGDLVWCINPDTGFRSIGIVMRKLRWGTVVYTFSDKNTGTWTRGYVFPAEELVGVTI